jgi:transcriptional regulator with XRE-family HTH domain
MSNLEKKLMMWDALLESRDIHVGEMEEAAPDVIKHIRNRLGITYKDLAGRIGVPVSQVSDVIHGRQRISKSMVRGLAQVCRKEFDLSPFAVEFKKAAK